MLILLRLVGSTNVFVLNATGTPKHTSNAYTHFGWLMPLNDQNFWSNWIKLDWSQRNKEKFKARETNTHENRRNCRVNIKYESHVSNEFIHLLVLHTNMQCTSSVPMISIEIRAITAHRIHIHRTHYLYSLYMYFNLNIDRSVYGINQMIVAAAFAACCEFIHLISSTSNTSGPSSPMHCEKFSMEIFIRT